MPAPRLSAQEYIQQLRAQRAQKQATPPSATEPPATPLPESPPQPETVATPPQPPITTVPASNVAFETDSSMPEEQVEEVLIDEPTVVQPIPEEVVLEWVAPTRPYKKRDRRYYLTVGTIVFLISLILFFAGQFLPIAVVISVAFLAYTLSAVPPGHTTNQITNYGIRIGNELYYWGELGRYWFDTKYHQKLIHVEVARLPWRLTLLLGELSEDQPDEFLSQVLIKQKPELSEYEKVAAWLQKMVPLDSE